MWLGLKVYKHVASEMEMEAKVPKKLALFWFLLIVDVY